MKLSSHISSVNYFTSAVRENRCNEQLIIQNNHPLNPIPLLNVFRGRSAMAGFTHDMNPVQWLVFYPGSHQPICTPHLCGSGQLLVPNLCPLTVQQHIQRQLRLEAQDLTSLDILGIYLSWRTSAQEKLSVQDNKISKGGNKHSTIIMSKVDRNQQ